RAADPEPPQVQRTAPPRPGADPQEARARRSGTRCRATPRGDLLALTVRHHDKLRRRRAQCQRPLRTSPQPAAESTDRPAMGTHAHPLPGTLFLALTLLVSACDSVPDGEARPPHVLPPAPMVEVRATVPGDALPVAAQPGLQPGLEPQLQP